ARSDRARGSRGRSPPDRSQSTEGSRDISEAPPSGRPKPKAARSPPRRHSTEGGGSRSPPLRDRTEAGFPPRTERSDEASSDRRTEPPSPGWRRAGPEAKRRPPLLAGSALFDQPFERFDLPRRQEFGR